MTVTERVDRFQRRHPGVGFPLVVLYKLGDDDGHFPAALLLRGNRQLKQQVPASALGGLPVIGPQLGSPDRLGGVQGMVIGTIVALYGGTGLGQALTRAGAGEPPPRRRGEPPVSGHARAGTPWRAQHA